MNKFRNLTKIRFFAIDYHFLAIYLEIVLHN
jgi:hypothetical protein